MCASEVPPRNNRLVLALPRYQSRLASSSNAVTVVIRHSEQIRLQGVAYELTCQRGCGCLHGWHLVDVVEGRVKIRLQSFAQVQGRLASKRTMFPVTPARYTSPGPGSVGLWRETRERPGSRCGGTSRSGADRPTESRPYAHVDRNPQHKVPAGSHTFYIRYPVNHLASPHNRVPMLTHCRSTALCWRRLVPFKS